MSVYGYIGVVKEIISRGGPEPTEYEFLKKIPIEMVSISLAEQKLIYELILPLLTVNSMLGFTFQKPHGYSGDFELIDRIYTQWKSKDKELYKWDLFYHELEGAKAVRNRIKYFTDLVASTEIKNKNSLILNLGSGPCRDLFECLKEKKEHTLSFECLDMDQKSIDYASVVCNEFMDSIIFINKNALTFDPGYKYNLIWSAGLFDYFNDKIFIRLLRRVYALLQVEGELVIGNFSMGNPSQAVMELYGQWYLHHRSEKQLVYLALEAGIPRALINVSMEEVGVNLFLHVRKV